MIQNGEDKVHYTTFEIEKILGIHKTTLAEWMRRGYVKPSFQKANGRGTKNLFDFTDLCRLWMFQGLVASAEVPRKSAAVMSNNPEAFEEVVVFNCGNFCELRVDLGFIKDRVLDCLEEAGITNKTQEDSYAG